MYKVMRIGTIKTWEHGRRASVYVEASVKDGRLSLTGVIGPLSGGNALGGFGQIDMEFAHRHNADNDPRESKPIRPDQINFAPGWDGSKWLDLLDIWKKWHLNDMRANCQHQTGNEWDASNPITIYHFRLNHATIAKRSDARDQIEQALKSGATFTPTPEQSAVSGLKSQITYHLPELPDQLAQYYAPNGPQYTGDHYNKASETKTAGLVHPEEHPDGILTKACPVCGYKYGTEWKSEALPDDVIAALESLPDADRPCPWRNL